MAGRCRSLAAAVFGVLATTIVQQVGLDLDPVVFAPVEDAVIELLTLSASSANNSSLRLTLTEQFALPITALLPWRFFSSPSSDTALLLLFIAYELYLSLRGSFTGRWTGTAANKQDQSTNEAKQPTRNVFGIAMRNTLFPPKLHRFCTNLGTVIFRGRQPFQQNIEQLHHHYQGLIDRMKVEFKAAMIELWQCSQEGERQIGQLKDSTSKLSSEVRELRKEINTASEEKELIRNQLHVLYQQLHDAESSLSKQEGVNATVCDQMKTQTQEYRELDEKLKKVAQEKAETLVIAKQQEDTIKEQKDQISDLSSKNQAKDELTHRLQEKTKTLEALAAKHDSESKSLVGTNSVLKSDDEESKAQKASVESERTKLDMEIGVLRDQNSQQTQTIQKLEERDNAIPQHDQFRTTDGGPPECDRPQALIIDRKADSNLDMGNHAPRTQSVKEAYEDAGRWVPPHLRHLLPESKSRGPAQPQSSQPEYAAPSTPPTMSATHAPETAASEAVLSHRQKQTRRRNVRKNKKEREAKQVALDAPSTSSRDTV